MTEAELARYDLDRLAMTLVMGHAFLQDGELWPYDFPHRCPGSTCAIAAWLHWKHLRSLRTETKKKSESLYENGAKPW